MMTRALLCGICLIAIHTSGGNAQTLASTADSPITNQPPAVDGTSKTPGKIPEVIRQPDGSENVPRSQAINDPGSVLKPPTINLQFLRATRLDWDQLGSSGTAAVR